MSKHGSFSGRTVFSGVYRYKPIDKTSNMPMSGIWEDRVDKTDEIQASRKRAREIVMGASTRCRPSEKEMKRQWKKLLREARKKKLKELGRIDLDIVSHTVRRKPSP